MSKLIIRGGNPISGEINITGAKNSVLPILASTILTKGQSIIYGCPDISDVGVCCDILKELGCIVERNGSTIIVSTPEITGSEISDYLMREMRSSIVFLGPILAKTSKAKLSFPGGCELGARPIDLHLAALRKMGAVIKEEHGLLDCIVDGGKLKGAHITLSFPSVGATENIILSAVLAQGTTTILNAAREPEVQDLAEFLIKCGADIKGAGSGTIFINGVSQLIGTTHKVIGDRIAAATYLAAAAVTKGELLVTGIDPEYIGSIIPVFVESGCDITVGEKEVILKAPKRLERISIIRTMPYPGFPTDAQAPIMAMSCLATGTSVFIETIFENRYKHVGELMRLGANIKVDGRVAVVEGVPKLMGASVTSTDLRGAAALVVAGLAAEGTTVVSELHHMIRGYENIEQNLLSIGADVELVED